MINDLFRFRLMLATVLVAAPTVAFAQAQVPTREGNIWNGRDHEPLPSQVIPDERAAGIAPSPKEQQLTTDEVERLYRSLMGNVQPSAK
jgi:hypothetical protein